MTENTLALMVLKGTISELPQEDQDKIKDYAGRIQAIMLESADKGKEEYGQLAITLVGLETAVALGQ